ncbi:hypothetical protein Ancab_002797 [Ancistrocladus abbreviatus]
MATNFPSKGLIGAKLKEGLIPWLEGFKEACSLHKVVILCYRSRSLLIRTGQCFLLNGFIFLGSVCILKSLVTPVLQWILPDQCPHDEFQELCSSAAMLKVYSALRVVLIQLLYLCWFYPMYAFSIVLSTIWYNEIAQHGFSAMAEYKASVTDSTVHKEVLTSDRPAGLGGVVIGIGEQVYSILLLSFFFLQVYVTGFIPYIGKALNFLLLSWMYAYYCFEYKWNLSGVSLDRRLDFFESNWTFFVGFGNPCVLAIFFLPPLESYAVMATLFPLFVLAATSSDADQLISSTRKNWGGVGLGRVPIFYVADTLSLRVLTFLRFGTPYEQKQQNKAL